MKTLKTTFAVILFFIASNNLIAQEEMVAKEESKVEMAKNFKLTVEKLTLTPEQQTSFKEIALKFGQKMKAIKTSDSDKKTKRQELKSLKTEKDAEIKSLLSEEQFKKYLEMQSERREKIKENRKK